MEWQPIETAPKDIVSKFDGSEFGKYVLGWPVYGNVARIRWWQADTQNRRDRGYENWLTDGDLAAYPTHWMPLPEPPDV